MTTTCTPAISPDDKIKIDLTGKEFPLFRVIYYTGRKHRNSPLWFCGCICGKFFEATTNKIRSGKTLSCGCYRKALFTPNSPVSWFQEGTNLNAFNLTKPSERNTSGVTGVSYQRNTGSWLARLELRGKFVLNEPFDTFEEAVAARKKAEEEHVLPLLEKYNLTLNTLSGKSQIDTPNN